MKSFFANVWEIAEVVIIALVTVIFVRTFIVQPFLVSGASMEPSFNNGNYLLIDEASYYFRDPQRGEVTIFKYPGNPSSFFIKRIIGLPGERVVVEKGQVSVGPADGELLLLSENYLSEGARTSGSVDKILEEDEYFVLGDNRNNSFDSRSWGALDEDNIIGLVRLRIFPFSKFGAVANPNYSF